MARPPTAISGGCADSARPEQTSEESARHAEGAQDLEAAHEPPAGRHPIQPNILRWPGLPIAWALLVFAFSAGEFEYEIINQDEVYREPPGLDYSLTNWEKKGLLAQQRDLAADVEAVMSLPGLNGARVPANFREWSHRRTRRYTKPVSRRF